MNKLKLNLDALRVETFAVSAAEGMAGGTVRAHDGAVATYGYNEPTCMVNSCQVACRTRYQVTCDTACY